MDSQDGDATSREVLFFSRGPGEGALLMFITHEWHVPISERVSKQSMGCVREHERILVDVFWGGGREVKTLGSDPAFLAIGTARIGLSRLEWEGPQSDCRIDEL